MSHHSKKQVHIALATYGIKASVMGAVSLVLNEVMALDLLLGP